MLKIKYRTVRAKRIQLIQTNRDLLRRTFAKLSAAIWKRIWQEGRWLRSARLSGEAIVGADAFAKTILLFAHGRHGTRLSAGCTVQPS